MEYEIKTACIICGGEEGYVCENHQGVLRNHGISTAVIGERYNNHAMNIACNENNDGEDDEEDDTKEKEFYFLDLIINQTVDQFFDFLIHLQTNGVPIETHSFIIIMTLRGVKKLTDNDYFKLIELNHYHLSKEPEKVKLYRQYLASMSIVFLSSEACELFYKKYIAVNLSEKYKTLSYTDDYIQLLIPKMFDVFCVNDMINYMEETAKISRKERLPLNNIPLFIAPSYRGIVENYNLDD
jgi:hypothetical protein